MSRPERKSRPRAFRLNGDETISSQQAKENAQSDFLKAKIIETEEDVYAREAIEHARLSGNEIDVPLNHSHTLRSTNSSSPGGYLSLHLLV